jgi:hypothetical protein
MSYDNKKVAADYWGTSPAAQQLQTAPAPDLNNLGPPPRQLSPSMLDFVKKEHPSLAANWIVLGVLALLPSLAFAGELIILPLLPLGLIVMGVITWTRVSDRRSQLKTVIEQGDLRPAEITSIRAFQVRQGRYSSAVRYHVVFALEDRSIEHVTYDAGMALVQEGLKVPVLWTPNLPDVIVPTFLLPQY